MKVFKAILFILFVIIFLITIFFPLNREESLVSMILTVSTFLFGVFIAFSLSDRQTRIDKIRENDSMERASLETLYSLMIVYGVQTQKTIREKIDNYLMATLDHTIWDYYKTEKEFKDLSTSVAFAKTNNGKKIGLFQNMVGLVTTMSNAREQTISLIDDKLSKLEWFVFSTLSCIIILSLLLINTGSIISIIMVTLLSLSVLLVLLLLHSLDSLIWKEEVRIFEPYQRTFEAVDLIRYYPLDVIKAGRVMLYKGKNYRVATFPNPYPNMDDKKIEIIRDSL